MKSNQKHLTLSDRIIIEQSINEGILFKSIAKEVKKRRTIKTRKDNSRKIKCYNSKECVIVKSTFRNFHLKIFKLNF